LSVFDVLSFGAADCDTDHYLVVAKVRERLAVNKQRSHKFYMERFSLKKLQLLHQRKQAKLQWLQDTSEIYGDILNNVRREASRSQEKKEGISERQNQRVCNEQ
jgi:hypothetical protein